MKPIVLKTAALAIVLSLGTACGTAHAWGGYGYCHRGPSGWVVGTALGLAAAGTIIALNQPTYVYPAPVYPAPVYPAPVYAAPQVVYSTAPIYAAPPAQTVASADVIAYPLRGQSASQQANDRAACEKWASDQSGFDPAQASQWTTATQTSSYSRSIGACMKGRGYSIN